MYVIQEPCFLLIPVNTNPIFVENQQKMIKKNILFLIFIFTNEIHNRLIKSVFHLHTNKLDNKNKQSKNGKNRDQSVI